MTDTHESTPEDLWILRGAAPTEPDTDDDESDDPDAGPGADPDADDESDADADPDADDDGDESDDDETDEVKSLKADLATAQNRITSLREKVKARGAEISTLRAKVQQGKAPTAKPKAKDSTDPEAVPDDDKAATRIAELESALADQRVRSAFDSNTKHSWHDPDVAFGLLDLDDVRDSDGKIDRAAFDDALTDLAKDRPYLVKTTTDETPKPKAKRPTGQQPGAHRRDRSTKSDYKSSFSALRNRT